MYKLLIADDEQIVLDSVRFVVENYMGGRLHVETARTGREAVEKAEAFRPDIVVMDIKMPGISGLDAIADIKKIDGGALFIVATAYEKFDFAKEALHLGAMEYLSKPLGREKLVSALENAIRLKDGERRRLDEELELKEKMAFIQPALESGFIYSMIFSPESAGEMESFMKVLGVNLTGGYVMTVEFGGEKGRAGPAGGIGATLMSQELHPRLRDAVKESCTCIAGPVMLNRIIAYVPCDSCADEYERRIRALHTASEAYGRLRSAAPGVEFTIGIGGVCGDPGGILRSYEESLRAIGYASAGGVFHINDIPCERGFKSYPEGEEKQLLKGVSAGDAEASLAAFERIFEWARRECGGSVQEAATALAELVVLLGRIARDYGIAGGAAGRESLNEFLLIDDMGALRAWLMSRIRGICEEIGRVRERKLSGVILAARDYISQNYCNDITLEDVSREVNISPNYFSKLFKDETGSNFIDYLTALRIEKAKKLLADSRYVNKEICYQIGYADPNYFSRIFKKVVGLTPTEYRASLLPRTALSPQPPPP
jgi:two-component system response regulator YesN